MSAQLDASFGFNELQALRRLVRVQENGVAFGEYETVAAGQSNIKLGVSGAVGDQINSILVIPATTSPGAITIADGNSAAITVFTGGTVVDIKPFTIPLNLTANNSTTPGWFVTTGNNVSIVAIGNFT